jgi:hypothetical protein
MAKLPEEIKHFIVTELACRRTPSEVVERVKEEYGLPVDRRHVHIYNPTKVQAKPVAKKWVKLFEETREAFDRDQSAISIAGKNFRLRELDDLYQRAKSKGNHVLAAQHLKQAAEEAGGAYTNRRELTGKDGKDLPATGAVVILPGKAPIEGGGDA